MSDNNIVGLVSVIGVFFMPVAFVWILMHYRAQRHRTDHLSADEQAAIETLTRVAERLEERVATLEKILDVEVPRWRQSYRDTGR